MSPEVHDRPDHRAIVIKSMEDSIWIDPPQQMVVALINEPVAPTDMPKLSMSARRRAAK